MSNMIIPPDEHFPLDSLEQQAKRLGLLLASALPADHGFILLLTRSNPPRRTYLSNLDRHTVKKLLAELVENLQSQGA